MVEAVPTPEYEDNLPPRGLDEHLKKIEKEMKNQYYHAQGLVIWNVTTPSAAAFPLRPFWNRLLGLNREYKYPAEKPMRYLSRIINKGIVAGEDDHIYVTCRKIRLHFEVTDLVTETIEKEKQDIQLIMLSLLYRGWLGSELASSGQIYRKPDILQFPESLIRWDEILKEKRGILKDSKDYNRKKRL